VICTPSPIAALARAAYDGYNDEALFTTVVTPQPPHLVSEIVLCRLRPQALNKHFIFGLYQMEMIMADGEHAIGVYAGILMQGQPVGFINYRLKVEGRGHSIGNNDSTKSANDISSTSIATARSGTISSPKDPRFKIEYQFDGVPIEST